MARRASLPRPPRVPSALQEFPAVVEPALRDIDDPPETTIEGFELVESQPLALPAATELVDASREAALGDDRVQTLLADKRYAVLGVSRLMDDKERQTPASLLLLYSYTDEQAYRVWLAGEGGDLRVQDVEEVEQQPRHPTRSSNGPSSSPGAPRACDPTWPTGTRPPRC